MKNVYIKILFGIVLLSSCGRKANLSTEVFNKSTFKETIEKAYADSTNKADQEVLLSFINYNLEGKISQFVKEAGFYDQVYDMKKDFESATPPANLTYSYILEKKARPFSIWLKNTKEFNEKIANSLDLQLSKFSKSSDLFPDIDQVEFDVQNKGAVDIASIKFNLMIENKSGEELFFQGYEINTKIIKGAKITHKIYDSGVKEVSSMDLNALTKRFVIKEISFTDGSTLIRPELPL